MISFMFSAACMVIKLVTIHGPYSTCLLVYSVLLYKADGTVLYWFSMQASIARGMSSNPAIFTMKTSTWKSIMKSTSLKRI